MANFVLLDHSLKGLGGHHFDYALHVLRAAESLGYDTVLASNKRFRGHAKLPRRCRVFPTFRFHTYSKYTVFAGKRKRHFDPAQAEREGPPQTTWAKWHRWHGQFRDWVYDLRHRNGPQRRIRDFSGGCRRLFSRIGLHPDDLVFVPTLSELDLAGLVTYLEHEPSTLPVNWHLQFHFNIFDGREPDYARQHDRLTKLKGHFQTTLARVPGHRLHFYNTSLPLTGQYNRLHVAPFENLPYPINSVFHTAKLSTTNAPANTGAVKSAKPLRITCAGGVRAEKGQDNLGSLVADLWSDCLATGKAQLLLQAKPARFTGRPRFELPLPDAAAARPTRTYLPAEECPDPVGYIRYPLGIDDYELLIRRADIGLLMYDSARYYSRRAGILGELLTSGVPVVVPAGCWLAEQIAEPIHRHVAGVLRDTPLLSRLTSADVAWDAAASEGVHSRQGTVALAPNRQASSCECSVPHGATELVVSQRWVIPQESGTYLRVEVEQLDEQGQGIDRAVTIVGRREGELPVPLLVSLKPNAWRLRLRLSNAYDEGPLTLRELQLSFLNSAETHPHGLPSGAVGLIAAEAGQAPRLLREMIAHYAHYRGTAEAFSVDWFQAHDPRRTVQTLQGKAVVHEKKQAA